MFEKSRPMSTYNLGFMITQENKFIKCKRELNDKMPSIYLRTYRDVPDMKQICENICKIYKSIALYFNISLPVENLYIITLPEVSTVRPLSSWGILILSENDLMQIGNFTLIQELVYQWVGVWKTPYWWSAIQINKAIVNFVAVDIALE
ncbi:PREDICTED: glutamyl aminopeptidase-like, partial [Bactrocera latifrons]|uniref:glutamyl aminopeptidase-like n=1 Tax=Bactrocera latifrons TaxID=174628 RepID=UPI0008DD5546